MNIEKHPLFLEQLKRHEGTRRDSKGRHRAYRCSAGALTIGWGHNLDARPVPGLGAGSAIDDARAEALLQEDCSIAAQELDWRLAWWRRLDEARAAVLLNMAFNLGIGRLLGFRRTLDAVREERYAEAAAAMLDSRWAGQVKRRAVELAEQMRTGRWQGVRLGSGAQPHAELEAELEVCRGVRASNASAHPQSGTAAECRLPAVRAAQYGNAPRTSPRATDASRTSAARSARASASAAHSRGVPSSTSTTTSFPSSSSCALAASAVGNAFAPFASACADGFACARAAFGGRA